MELEKSFRHSENIIKLGIAVIGFILVVCLGLHIGLRLKEPVYLKTYKEYFTENFVNGSVYLKLKYLSNVYDDREVSYVTFPECSDMQAYKGEESWFFDNGSQDYVNRDIHVCFEYKEIDLGIQYVGENAKEERTITKALIHYTNGDEQEVDLGKLYFHSGQGQYHEVISNSTTSSSSDGTGYIEGASAEKIEVLNIKSSPMADIKDNFVEMKLGEHKLVPTAYQEGFREIQGIQYNKGDTIRVENKISKPDTILEQFSTYELMPVMCVKNEDGEEYQTFLNNITYDAEIGGFLKICRYLKARGAFWYE